MRDTSKTPAALKLRKARRFLDAAGLLSDLDLDDAVVSLAVSAAINAADAIQIVRAGDYVSGADHAQAVSVLRKLGEGDAAKHLGRCLASKSKAQYSPSACSRRDAEAAVKHAERILRRAETCAREDGVIS